jgi:alpha-glucuronidase
LTLPGEDGYELWLRYRAVDDPARRTEYRGAVESATVLGDGATAGIVRDELARALPALLGGEVSFPDRPPE